jgi:TctA family transporter
MLLSGGEPLVFVTRPISLGILLLTVALAFFFFHRRPGPAPIV